MFDNESVPGSRADGYYEACNGDYWYHYTFLNGGIGGCPAPKDHDGLVREGYRPPFDFTSNVGSGQH